MLSVEREFVSLVSPTAPRNGAGFFPCQGLYHRPKDKRPKVAFIATHYNVDFSEHYLGDYMAQRGYGFLGWNTRFRGNEAFFILEHALIDIGVGVRWLKEQAGVERVVILGNSGGGSLMGAYQSQAVDPNITGTAGGKLPPRSERTDRGRSLRFVVRARGATRSADGVDGPFGYRRTRSDADRSVDEHVQPQNGPPYSADFVARYRAAQETRNHRITDWVWSQLDQLKKVGLYDRAFILQRTWADPRLMDGALDPSERPVGVCYAGDPKAANFSPRGIGLTNTLRTWLSMWSLRDSHCRGAPHLQRIKVPALVIQSMGDTGVFPSDARGIHDALGATDKTLQFITGDHYLEDPPNARDNVADLIAAWVAKRN